MSTEELTPEEIEANWTKYRTMLEKLGSRTETALTMVTALEERLCLAPASGRTDYHNAFPGGLVDHSLRVLGNAAKLCKTFGWDVPKDSLILACLFHDLGKVGDVENDYYVPQDEQWRIDKYGALYKINMEMQYMAVPQRSLFLCQHFGLKLTQDETLAILLHDGQYVEANKDYCFKEPLLADIVALADVIACKQEKGKL